MYRSSLYLMLLCFAALSCTSPDPPQGPEGFRSAWPTDAERVWVGPDYWANRLQDWRLIDGEVMCVTTAPNRNLHLLTHQLSREEGGFTLQVHVHLLHEDAAETDSNWVGFRIGAQGQFDDYRDAAVHGTGLHAGITATGKLFLEDPSQMPDLAIEPHRDLDLRIEAVPEQGGTYKLTLSALPAGGTTPLSVIERRGIAAARLVGNVALVSHFQGQQNDLEQPTAAFSEWQLVGEKVTDHPDRAFGPVLFTQHTLSKGMLTLTAQMPPIGSKDAQKVRLEIKQNGRWQEAAQAPIDPLSRTATFHLGWDDTRDTPYRVVYDLYSGGNVLKPYTFEGTIRKDPVDKEEIVVAGFTGNNDLGFPNNEVVENVVKQQPDFLFFSGDQIYEGVGGYGIQTAPLEKASLDYLRKWYLYGWAYGELLRDIPSIAIPDDHDVYHGNIWGAGGKAAQATGNNYDRQDSGGYKMPAAWVNMVQRTQTSHFPPPYDPTPVEQGITVYYTDLVYGGISFAILEDRKFKSAPKALLPQGEINNGWAQNRSFDAKTEADAPGAVLLGERQLAFLEDWAADWRHGAWMKVVLSQTIFANVATLPREEYHDAVVPRLRILHADEYAPDDRPVADMDSNGWPQTGRDLALRAMRIGFAFHLAGDQHLGSTIQYGIDEWGDAGYALCVPAISNVWPRRWYPSEKGQNRVAGKPRYTGDFEDGFGNKITVHAVSNPIYSGREPSRLYDRATGYGIATFNRDTRNIEVASWERDTDPTLPDARPYPDWPIRFNQMDNYGRTAVAHLPEIQVSGMTNPVVLVKEEATGEIVYTLRIKGTAFQPKVFAPGTYTVTVGDPDTGQMKTFTGVGTEGGMAISVSF